MPHQDDVKMQQKQTGYIVVAVAAPGVVAEAGPADPEDSGAGTSRSSTSC